MSEHIVCLHTPQHNNTLTSYILVPHTTTTTTRASSLQLRTTTSGSKSSNTLSPTASRSTLCSLAVSHCIAAEASKEAPMILLQSWVCLKVSNFIFTLFL